MYMFVCLLYHAFYLIVYCQQNSRVQTKAQALNPMRYYLLAYCAAAAPAATAISTIACAATACAAAAPAATAVMPPLVLLRPVPRVCRGGAWVVIDGQINAGLVEMYADPAARGGVLEPEAVAEIKFRTPELIAMMHRWGGRGVGRPDGW